LSSASEFDAPGNFQLPARHRLYGRRKLDPQTRKALDASLRMSLPVLLRRAEASAFSADETAAPSHKSLEREAARQTRSFNRNVNSLVSRQGGIIEILFRLSTAARKIFQKPNLRPKSA
jgi:hypothetical protein